MKIVFFIHRYWPVVGGVEKYVQELARALVAMGHRVDVVAGASGTGLRSVDLPDREVHEGVHIYRFPALRSKLRIRWWMWRNIDLFRRADVIHVGNTHMLECFWRFLGFLIDRRKVFLTRHGMSYICPVPEWEKRRAIRSLELAAGVVHDGAFIEKWLGVKPDLCPDQGLTPPADELAPIPEPPPTSAVYIGRLEPDSGINIYLDAVRILTGGRTVRCSDQPVARIFQLDVYGDGSLAPGLRSRVRREALPVVLHGRVADAQTHITDGCFAFVDGRMAIQEAMARRRLVFAGHVDPLKRDYVGTESFSPYIVTAANGARLAEKVARYIDDPERRRAAVDRAFQHARTLTWSRTAEAYVHFWEQRLANPGLRRSHWATLKTALALNGETFVPKTKWAY